MTSYEKLKIKYDELCENYHEVELLLIKFDVVLCDDYISDTDKVRIFKNTLEASGYVKK